MKATVFILLLVLSSLLSSAQLTEQEPNNNFAQANPLPVGITMTGVTCAFPETDFFRIVLPQDGILRISTSISANDPAPGPLTFTLYSKTQNSFGDQNPMVGANSIPKTDSLFLGCLSADTFYLAVHSNAVGFGYCFNYVFSYTVLPPVYTNDAEPNDNLSQALPLAYNTTAQGHVGFGNNPGSHLDQDYYRVVLPQDGVIRVITQAEHVQGTPSTIPLSLIDKNGNFFNDYNIDVGANHVPITDTFYWGCLAADTSYLRVYLNNTVDCGISYSIKFNVLGPVFSNDTEPNDNIAQALPLAYNTTAQGHLGFANNPGSHLDVDYYRIILPHDGLIRIITKAEHVQGTSNTEVLTLFDKTGSVFYSFSFDVGANHIPITDTFYWGCVSADTFYLRTYINNTVDCGVTYSIKYDMPANVFGQDTEPNDNFIQAQFAALNTNTDGHLGFSNHPGFHLDDDYFKIALPAPGDLKVVASAEGYGTGNGPLILTVFNSSQNPFTADRLVVVGTNNTPITDTFDYGCLPSGTYYFRIFINNTVECGITYRLKFVNGSQLLNLGNDTTICGPVNLTLNAGSSFTSYLWNTGATSQTITVTDSGYYSVKVTDGCGATLRDTIHITRQGNAVPLQLPNDTTICNGVVNIPLSVPAGYTNIVWSTGSTSQQITATSAGTYWVRAQSSCGGLVSDTIHILVGTIQVTADSIQNLSIGIGDSLRLVACATGTSYLWQSAQPINCSTCPAITVSPTQDAQYVSYVTDNGCRQTCRYNVTVVSLPDGFDVPNAFTPNGDTHNDVFRILYYNITALHLNYFRIFNTYGELVFTTTDISKGWDGTFKGKKAVQGAYVYDISIDNRGRQVSRFGTVLLIR